MTGAQRQLALLIGLVLICGGVYLRRRTPTTHPADQSAITTSASSSPAVMVLDLSQHLHQRTLQHERAKLLVWNRDPFLRNASGALDGMSLSGIIWDQTHPMAMVNGTAVAVGDEIDGFRVLDIQQDHVTVTDGAETHQLRMAP